MNTLLDEQTRIRLSRVVAEGEKARQMLQLDDAGVIAAPETDEGTEPDQAGDADGEDQDSNATVTPITEKVDTAAARAWLRQQGLTVSERGRIGADLLDKYRNRPQNTKTSGAKATSSKKDSAKTSGAKGAKAAADAPGIPPVTFNPGAPARRRTPRAS